MASIGGGGGKKRGIESGYYIPKNNLRQKLGQCDFWLITAYPYPYDIDLCFK